MKSVQMKQATYAPLQPTRRTSVYRTLWSTVNTIVTVAYRDVRRFLSNRLRIAINLMFPLLFVIVLGGTVQSNLGRQVGYNFLLFVFTGVFAQTMFQTTVNGLVSLIEDRESDFSQEMLIAPVPRPVIVLGKIIGESSVALLQGLFLITVGLFAFGVPFSPLRLLMLLLVGVVVCLLGGAFGLVVIAVSSSQRTAHQILPFVLFPQYFLAGVFTPIKILPWYLDWLSRIMPIRYGVDLVRCVFYAEEPDYPKVVLHSLWYDLLIVAAMFIIGLFLGTWLFVRSERNR